MAVFGRMSILGALAAAVTAMHDAIIAAAIAARDFIALAFAFLAPEPMRFATEGYVDFNGTGSPVDPALQQSMRHEAGVPRRAAARHT